MQLFLRFAVGKKKTYINIISIFRKAMFLNLDQIKLYRKRRQGIVVEYFNNSTSTRKFLIV